MALAHRLMCVHVQAGRGDATAVHQTPRAGVLLAGVCPATRIVLVSYSVTVTIELPLDSSLVQSSWRLMGRQQCTVRRVTDPPSRVPSG